MASISPILAESLLNVLEVMCFTVVDGFADAPTDPVPSARVSLSFEGHEKGLFWLSMPLSSANEISLAFTGSSELNREQTADVVSEIANIVCGSTLSRYANDGIFNLDAPTFTWELKDSTFPEDWRHSDRVDLQIGAAVVSAGIKMESVQ